MSLVHIQGPINGPVPTPAPPVPTPTPDSQYWTNTFHPGYTLILENTVGNGPAAQVKLQSANGVDWEVITGAFDVTIGYAGINPAFRWEVGRDLIGTDTYAFGWEDYVGTGPDIYRTQGAIKKLVVQPIIDDPNFAGWDQSISGVTWQEVVNFGYGVGPIAITRATNGDTLVLLNDGRILTSPNWTVALTTGWPTPHLPSELPPITAPSGTDIGLRPVEVGWDQGIFVYGDTVTAPDWPAFTATGGAGTTGDLRWYIWDSGGGHAYYSQHDAPGFDSPITKDGTTGWDIQVEYLQSGMTTVGLKGTDVIEQGLSEKVTQRAFQSPIVVKYTWFVVRNGNNSGVVWFRTLTDEADATPGFPVWLPGTDFLPSPMPQTLNSDTVPRNDNQFNTIKSGWANGHQYLITSRPTVGVAVLGSGANAEVRILELWEVDIVTGALSYLATFPSTYAPAYYTIADVAIADNDGVSIFAFSYSTTWNNGPTSARPFVLISTYDGSNITEVFSKVDPGGAFGKPTGVIRFARTNMYHFTAHFVPGTPPALPVGTATGDRSVGQIHATDHIHMQGAATGGTPRPVPVVL